VGAVTAAAISASATRGMAPWVMPIHEELAEVFFQGKKTPRMINAQLHKAKKAVNLGEPWLRKWLLNMRVSYSLP
jgi:hypothetical protein